MQTKYRIFTVTSNFSGAGFKSNVFIQIFGSINSKTNGSYLTSVRFPLDVSIDQPLKFQPGQTDIFETNQELIDRIKKVRITHNEKNSRWHLKYLVIELLNSGKQWKFYCNQWVDGSEFGVELKPLKQETEEYESIDVTKIYQIDSTDHSRKENDSEKIKYKIKIVTKEFSKKLSDLKIKLKIIGNGYETGYIKIEDLSMIHIFKSEQNDVGEVTKLIDYFNKKSF